MRNFLYIFPLTSPINWTIFVRKSASPYTKSHHSGRPTLLWSVPFTDPLPVELIRRNSDYGLRTLVRMAGQPVGTIFSATSLSQHENVPEGFLYKILQKLSRRGIVASFRGPGGGFALALPPSEVTVRAILEAIQGPIAVNRCFLGQDRCPNQPNCTLCKKLTGLQTNMVSLFEDITLEHLLEKHPQELGLTGPKAASPASGE